VVFAVDGLEWRVVLPLLRAGEMPNLEALMGAGTFGFLETIEPTLSPVVWTTIATGKGPDEHGIHHFVRREGEDGELTLYDNRDRRTKAIWNIASEAGRRVAVLGWWLTFPVERVNGVMVAQTNTLSQFDTRQGNNVWKGSLIEGQSGQVYPPEREAEAMAVLARTEETLDTDLAEIFEAFHYPLSALGQRLWDSCRWCFRADATYLGIAEELLKEDEPWDLLAVYFGGTDVVGHRFWRYMQPTLYAHPPTSERISNFGDVIPSYYRYVDWALGRLMAEAPGARFFVLSDHGMGPINRDKLFDPDDPPADVNSAHHPGAPLGVIVAAGPGIAHRQGGPVPSALRRKDLQPLATVFDVTPTLLELMDLPVGDDMRGRPDPDLIAPEFLATHPVRHVPTHDSAEWLARHRARTSEDPGAAERMQQLRDLGYVGEGD